ncbi:MAG: ferritin [Candidatus Omnitrophica bacterium]|nr:ferritin [Candidatus Omnitrophota bacterium]
MVIKDKVMKSINKQINAELYSGYLYRAMAAYFESINLPGFARWMEKQAEEEHNHAMKFYKYVFERGGRVVLGAIDAPPSEWKSPLDAFKQAYAHELKVTALINEIMKIARSEDDTATESMLKWFIDEQVEEEANAKFIVDRLALVKDHVGGLMIMDHELGERK